MGIVALIKGVATKMNEETAEDLRGHVSNLLRRARLPPNLEKDEWGFLKALREDKNITILQADKGNAIVIMDMTQYEKRIWDLLPDPFYRKVKKTQHVQMRGKCYK